MNLLQKSSLILLVVSLGSAVLPAQSQSAGLVSCEITPNPVPIGMGINITMTARANIDLTTNCVVRRIRRGSPIGIPAFSPPCFQILTPVSACAQMSQNWNGIDDLTGLPAAPGDYWVGIQYMDAQGNGPFQDFFPFTIVASILEPSLVAMNTAQIGQTLNLQVQAPVSPSVPFVAACSLTSNVGVPVTFTERLALDIDFLFLLSFPSPNPGLFPVPLAGVLDASGNSPILQMNIPAIPSLQCRSLVWQAAVVPATGVQLTNGLSFTIN